MKKRILALILTVVMSLLALTSCGSFDFAKEDLSQYVDFDATAFLKALEDIKIEDGDFTSDEATREKIIKATIYNAVAGGIVNKAKDDDKLTEGEITAGDVLYFAYRAEYKDEDNNIYNFFGSYMGESSLQNVNLGNYFYTDDSKIDEEFLTAVIDEVNKNLGAFNAYSVLTKEELQEKAEEDFEPDSTKTDAENKAALTVAKDNAIVVKNGDGKTYSVSYTVKYTDSEGAEHTETVAYKFITLDGSTDFDKILSGEGVSATVDPKVSVSKKDADNKTVTSFDVEGADGVKYTYSDIKFNWIVEKEGTPIQITYTPYTESKEVLPDNALNSQKVELKDKELTYYIYPVHVIAAPTYDEITAADILYYAIGSTLTTDSLDCLSDSDFKNGDKSITDLIAEVAKIYDKTFGSDYFKDGGALYEVHKAVTDAEGKTENKPTTEELAELKAARSDAQDAEFKKIVDQIAAAVKGEEKLADLVIDDYYEDTEHDLIHEYDNQIVTAVGTEVYNLIKDIKVKAYPEKLVKEFRDHLYEEYEYEFYKGDFDSKTTNYDKYGNLNAYLIATLKLKDISELDGVLNEKAKEYIKPMLQIYAVAKGINAEASKKLSSYLEADIKAGKYTNEDDIDFLRKVSGSLVVDKAYMKQYKKYVGSAVYRDNIDTYGEINLRVAEQTNVLLGYLLSCDITYEDGHGEVNYTEDGKVAFRTLKYSIKVEE